MGKDSASGISGTSTTRGRVQPAALNAYRCGRRVQIEAAELTLILENIALQIVQRTHKPGPHLRIRGSLSLPRHEVEQSGARRHRSVRGTTSDGGPAIQYGHE